MASRPAYNLKRRIKSIVSPDYIEQFMLALRRVEYLSDKTGLVTKINSFIAKNRFKKISVKLGFSISPNVFGPGLYIPHYGTIVVNGNARVGANCVLHTSTCIGGSERKVLGDNLYISTGAIILGDITIADNVTISANSLVNKSFTDSNVLIGGTPAKVIKQRDTWFDCEGHDAYAAYAKQIEGLRKAMLAK